ncbi:hypothetical protein INR49_029084 [Caranx melampygus]|nr:hypothetical protein INR49_029084 [Caranx melampygus]
MNPHERQSADFRALLENIPEKLECLERKNSALSLASSTTWPEPVLNPRVSLFHSLLLNVLIHILKWIGREHFWSVPVALQVGDRFGSRSGYWGWSGRQLCPGSRMDDGHPWGQGTQTGLPFAWELEGAVHSFLLIAHAPQVEPQTVPLTRRHTPSPLRTEQQQQQQQQRASGLEKLSSKPLHGFEDLFCSTSSLPYVPVRPSRDRRTT